jgi:hypothetical protein
MNRWNIKNSAPLGSPENPEIIEVGRDPRENAVRAPGRFARAFQILMWMIYVTAPAFFVDSVWFWLFDSASQSGGAVTWLLLILFTPPALVATLFATVADSFLLLVFFATLLGKSVNGHPANFVKFIRLG